MSATRPITVRSARVEDVPAIADMVDDFVRDHPARKHPRSADDLRDAYFGPNPVAEIVVAERAGEVVGMGQWARIFDMFWGMRGGRAEWLYLRPEVRGLGVWAAIIATIASRVRAWGGEFLVGAGNDDTRRLYARSALPGGESTDYHLSAKAFEEFADLAGLPPREVIRQLPDPILNKVPARERDGA